MSRHLFLTTLAVSSLALAATARADEICGNGIDDNGNGAEDEGCYPTLNTGVCESPLSCEQTGMISPKNGSLHYSLPPDVAPKVPWGPGIGFRRFYTSQYNPGTSPPVWKKPLGDRWQHTYMSWLTKTGTGTGSTISLHTSRGEDIHFTYSGPTGLIDSLYVPQTRFHVGSLATTSTCTPSCTFTGYKLTLLTGETLMYNTSGRLTAIKDPLGKAVSIAYDANQQVSTVTDSQGKRRLLFAYTSGLLTSVTFQILFTSTWTTEHTTTYAYTSGALTSVTIGGQLAQQNTYTSSYLTKIADGAGNVLVNFGYDSSVAGAAVRADTTSGMLGFERTSSRTDCSGKTVVYFNLGATGTCNADSDCATGQLCGGKDGTANSGRCFRGARCLGVDATNPDLVTTVAPLAPTGQTCDGACTDVAQYLWNSNGLRSIEDAGNVFENRVFNSNGMPTEIRYGATNADTSTAARTVFLYYTNSTFPALVTEVRRKSDLSLSASSCSNTNSTGCAQTIITYATNGRPSSVSERGTTVDQYGSRTQYQYNTSYTFDTNGRVTQIALPRGSATDTTLFEYWSSTDPLKDGFLQNYKRQLATSSYVTSSTLEYDFWGNPTVLVGADTDSTHSTGSVTCLTFSSARGYLTTRREAMAGQGDCTTTNSADITTSWARDSALRLTQLTRPDGGCVFYEYGHTDSTRPAHLLRSKRRDDCVSSNAGDKQEFVYDAEGLVTEVQTYDSAGTLTAKQPYSYFDSRKLEKVINPVDTSKSTAFTYDSSGESSQVDAAGNLGKTVYHRDGTPGLDHRVTSVDRYKDASTFDTWNFLYDWLGDQTSVTDGDSKTIGTARDDLGRVVFMAAPEQTLWSTQLAYDSANRLVARTHEYGWDTPAYETYTYDRLGRLTAIDYNNQTQCSTPTTAHPDVQQQYDTLSGVTCPTGMTCSRTGGRLAYVKVTLMCSSTYWSTDGALDQETFYAYDDAGRVIREYIRDDTGRTADHVYTYNKNGDLASVTTPSGAVVGWTYGSTGNNSDSELVSAVWRTNTSTPIVDQVSWYPYGPLKQFNQQHKVAGVLQRTVFARNVAYRATNVAVENQTDGADTFTLALAEDAKGRVTKRDYTNGASGVQDSYFLYDDQDRLMCESTSLVSSCPTSGTNIKNSRGTPAFTNAGDWREVIRPVPGSTGLVNSFNPNGYGTTHEITLVRQNDGTPQLGDTVFQYDTLGNRTSDDNTSTLTHDARSYTYDAAGNVINVHGQYLTGGSWHGYDVASRFDAKGRRVAKTFSDNSTGVLAQWFFYYDPGDNLVEIRYTPDGSSPSNYEVFQLFWLRARLIGYWQTSYPAATTSRRYVTSDETGRPLELWDWPTGTGNATRAWAINPSAWGGESPLLGASLLQFSLFAAQYIDSETAALSDSGVVQRAPLALNGVRTYDAFTGGYLQVDPLADETRASYGFADSNPVGFSDAIGAAICAGPENCTEGEFGIQDGTGSGYCSYVCMFRCGIPGLGGGCDCETCNGSGFNAAQCANICAQYDNTKALSILTGCQCPANDPVGETPPPPTPTNDAVTYPHPVFSCEALVTFTAAAIAAVSGAACWSHNKLHNGVSGGREYKRGWLDFGVCWGFGGGLAVIVGGSLVGAMCTGHVPDPHDPPRDPGGFLPWPIGPAPDHPSYNHNGPVL